MVSCDSTILKKPSHFPKIDYPDDNLPTKERIDLGEKLFFSTIFSEDSTKGCFSCHHPSLAFADTLPVSFGVKNRLGVRNSPPLFNVAFEKQFLRDGIVPTLEKQVVVPIHEHDELDFNIVKVAERMNQDSLWVELSKKAYHRRPSPFVITRALAAFQRTLFSGTSPYDEFLKGNPTALTEEQKLGENLFFGKANCSKCHSGVLLTNQSLKNNGLYEKYSDSGRMRLTMLEKDRALFKVPSLRNVEVTRPYMHNGAFSSLEEVVEHYSSGGKNHPNKSELIQELQLTSQEKQALVAFLKSLTDQKAIEFYTKKHENYK